VDIKTVTIGDKKIRYSDQGNGQPIVLLHGFVERIEIWDWMSETLSESNRVVCIELPGHGESEVIDEVQTMEKMANHIHILIRQLELENYVLIGHSMGGYISLAYAELYEHELAGVGLFHSNATADSEEKKMGRGRAVEIIQRDKSGFIFSFIPNLFAEINQPILSNEIEKLQQGAKDMTKEALVACIKGMALRTDKIVFLSSTPLPVMFILGKEDLHSPVNEVMTQTLLPKHSEVLILGDCAHMGYLEKPSETVKFIQSFASHLSSIYKKSQ
jgi:pimeloyl-ACP methyl ester carboxylesterase